jgi:Holliday junction resolvase RusA-like endonuclease
MKFTINLPPVTKKNHSQIIVVGGRPRLIPSKQYIQYEKDCQFFMPRILTIDRPINVKAIYYMSTRRKVDLPNLHNALHDVLVAYRVVEDDNYKIIASTDGSRVRYDKDNPRTEIEITEVDD